MRTATFDIETSDLAAVGAGTLLVVVVKPLGRPPQVFRADTLGCKPGKEKKLLLAVLDALAPYDLWVGHNLARFDVPWLRSRAIQFDLDWLARPFIYDTMQAFRRLGYKSVPNRIGKPSAGLGHVADFLGEKQEKTGIFPREHWQTVWGDAEERKRSMDKLTRHCVADVRMTERAYYKLLEADTRAVIKRAY